MNDTVIEEQIHSEWEELVSRGMEAREAEDGGRWELGDLAGEVTTKYGDDSMGKFAYAIGRERKTLMNYRTIAAKFSPQVRKTYQKLSFSHFAVLTAVTEPTVWLEKADNDDWSIETLRKELNKMYAEVKDAKIDDEPPLVYRCPECNLWRLKDMSSFDICRGHYKLEGGKINYK